MSKRKDRLADEVRDILASCLLGGQMQDPRLAGVTIIDVRLSGDLQIASVYFRVFGDMPHKKSLVGLQRATPFLRKHLAQTLDIRRVPELRFFFDESPERAARIDELFAQIKAGSHGDS